MELFIIVVLVVVCCVIGLVANTKIQAAQKNHSDIIRKLNRCGEELDELRKRNERLVDANERLVDANDMLRLNNVQLNAQLDAAVRLSNVVEDYEDGVDNVHEKMAALGDEVDDRRQELNDVAAQHKELSAKVVEAQNEYDRLRLELDELIEELERAKETNRMILLDGTEDREDWFDFELSDKEWRLVGIVKEISALYPELTKDFAAIEWKKVWLPKFQDLVGKNGLVCRGIYRLVLKADEDVCYVGQATNIKERWYEHAKKMLGADAKGSEKLYKYRPEDFYWTVVERRKNDGSSLNDVEKYWIQYYACKEIGLNKKV